MLVGGRVFEGHLGGQAGAGPELAWDELEQSHEGVGLESQGVLAGDLHARGLLKAEDVGKGPKVDERRGVLGHGLLALGGDAGLRGEVGLLLVRTGHDGGGLRLCPCGPRALGRELGRLLFRLVVLGKLVAGVQEGLLWHALGHGLLGVDLDLFLLGGRDVRVVVRVVERGRGVAGVELVVGQLDGPLGGRHGLLAVGGRNGSDEEVRVAGVLHELADGLWLQRLVRAHGCSPHRRVLRERHLLNALHSKDVEPRCQPGELAEVLGLGDRVRLEPAQPAANGRVDRLLSPLLVVRPVEVADRGQDFRGRVGCKGGEAELVEGNRGIDVGAEVLAEHLEALLEHGRALGEADAHAVGKFRVGRSKPQRQEMSKETQPAAETLQRLENQLSCALQTQDAGRSQGLRPRRRGHRSGEEEGLLIHAPRIEGASGLVRERPNGVLGEPQTGLHGAEAWLSSAPGFAKGQALLAGALAAPRGAFASEPAAASAAAIAPCGHGC